jgi:uncharacterized membrane protein SirB2
MYLVIKYLHVTCVVISITGFVLRGLLMFADSPIQKQKWLRWAPHVNDSLLLAAAITLSLWSGQYPLVEPWLTAKIFGLIAYIILGSIALDARRGKAIRFLAWLSALLTFAYIAAVALSRNPWAILAML